MISFRNEKTSDEGMIFRGAFGTSAVGAVLPSARITVTLEEASTLKVRIQHGSAGLTITKSRSD